LGYFGVWRNAHFTVNGVNLSDHVREVSLETSISELPDNILGSETEIVRAGLESWTVNATFLQDFAASKIDATLSALNSATQASFQLILYANAGAAVSATNPRYSGSAILTSYRPMGGPHGSNLEATATFRSASDLARTTS